MENKPGVGSTIATIIIILVIILGGLYFWGKHVEESKMTQNMQAESGNTSETNMLNIMGSVSTTTVTQ